MPAGGVHRWQDDITRLDILQRMVTRLSEIIKYDQHASTDKLVKFAADVEVGAFSSALSKGDYLRRTAFEMQCLDPIGQRALQAAAENHKQQIQIDQQMKCTSLSSCDPESMAQHPRQPVVEPTAQPNHFLQHNTSVIYGVQAVQQQPTHFIWNQQVNMESQLVTPASEVVTINQQGKEYSSSAQTPEMPNRDEAVDWREQVFQQIELWKAAFFSDLMELNWMVAIPKMTQEQLQSLPKNVAAEYERKSYAKKMITHILVLFGLQKSEISDVHRRRLPKYHITIQKLLEYHRKLKATI